MDRNEIMHTPIWDLYEKGRNYHRLTNIYTDSDRNYRFYNGDQWEGAKLGGVEPVQKNFIKPIVKYKLAVIHDNLYRVVFEAMNFEVPAFRKSAERYCKLLNNYIGRVWEQDKMDLKIREATKDAAINSEGILFVWYDDENGRPTHEVVKKSDIYYGNENDPDIQNQPYILIRKRMPVSLARDYAKDEGVSEENRSLIVGDMDNYDESGDAAKVELDQMVTVVYKLYKHDKEVHYSVATRLVNIVSDANLGITLYPVAHMTWESKEGSARGEGEVKNLIANQIEVNKTELRRVLTVKEQAFPTRIVDVSKISNPEALKTVGATLETDGQGVDDVNKIVGFLQPAQMSSDVKLLQDDLINMSRELAGAGETATGTVDPEQASGKAILAVQQAQRAPVTEQKESTKNLIEDVAKIDLEMLIANAEKGVNVEEETTNKMTGETSYAMVNIPKSAMEQLKAFVKIEVTPKSPYDRFAQERTLENLLLNGFFNVQRLSEFKVYVRSLPDDSVAPKQILLDIIKEMEDSQKRIANIQANAQMVQERYSQFISGDPDDQAEQIANAQMQLVRDLQNN